MATTLQKAPPPPSVLAAATISQPSTDALHLKGIPSSYLSGYAYALMQKVITYYSLILTILLFPRNPQSLDLEEVMGTLLLRTTINIEIQEIM